MGESRAARRYRAVDLAMWALLLVLFESIIILAATRWFPGQPYTVSLTAEVTALVMARWGLWGALHAALGGAVYCFLSGGGPAQYLIYCGGNLFCLLALGVLQALGGVEKVRQDALKTLLYALCAVVFMQAGRGCVSLLLGTPLEGALLFITADSVSILFTLTLLWIARRLDGVMENQYHYLRRLQEEQEKERGGFR